MVGKIFPAPTVRCYLDIMTTGVIEAKIIFKRNKCPLNFGRLKREFETLLFQGLLNIFRIGFFDWNTESVIRRNKEKICFDFLNISEGAK